MPRWRCIRSSGCSRRGSSSGRSSTSTRRGRRRRCGGTVTCTTTGSIPAVASPMRAGGRSSRRCVPTSTSSGSFAPALADADDHRYRSVILAAQPSTFADLVATDARVAANGPDSLSGWISLRAAARGLDDAWPRRVRWAGDHVESIRALQAGRADVISIDELTLAHLRQHVPELVAGLVEVARGPLVPSLPVIVPADTPPSRVEDLRGALTAAFADSALAAARGTAPPRPLRAPRRHRLRRAAHARCPALVSGRSYRGCGRNGPENRGRGVER